MGLRSVWVVLGLWMALAAGGCEAILGLSERVLQADAGQDAGLDGGAGDAAVDAAMDAGEPSPCQTYCDEVLSACTGRYKPYADEATCLAACALMPEGDLEEATPLGNSVACRLRQARLAGTTKEFWDHCVPAGPGGGGVCGDNCEGYCQLFNGVCDEVADCERRCAGLRDLDDETKANFDDSNLDLARHASGETLQCRIVQVSAALLDSDLCPRATIAPRDIDGEPHPCNYSDGDLPRCEDYCRLSRVACTDERAVYETWPVCMDACAATPVGLPSDSGGQDTVGCRIAHSYNALDAAATHCPHSGPGGEGVCGDDCISYCRLLKSACPGHFDSEFNSDGECVAACGSLAPGPKYAVDSVTTGDTVGCRLLHTVRAFEDADNCAAAVGAAPCNAQ